MVINETGELEFTTEVVKLEEEEPMEDWLEAISLETTLLELTSEDEMEGFELEEAVTLVSSKLESKDVIWELSKLEFSMLRTLDNDSEVEGNGISHADNKVVIKMKDLRYCFFISPSYQCFDKFYRGLCIQITDKTKDWNGFNSIVIDKHPNVLKVPNVCIKEWIGICVIFSI